MATYHVQVMRMIETSVEVEADSPAAAAARVERADFPLPEHNQWGTVKGDELRVFDRDFNEIEDLDTA